MLWSKGPRNCHRASEGSSWYGFSGLNEMTKSSARAKTSHSRKKFELRELLGNLPLLNGEDAEAFDKFYSDLSRFFAPTNIIEEIYVRNYVDLSWEIERYRRDLANFINANLYWGLLDLLQPLCDYERAQQLAKGWSTGAPQDTQTIEQMFANVGLSRDQIRAQTMAVKINDIERFNHLILVLETRRDSVIREFDRFRTTFRMLHPEAVQDADVIEMEGPRRLQASSNA